MANKLKIAKVSALAVLSDTTATTNVITVDSTTGLTQGDRFVPASTVGGLTGGTTYFVKEVIDATTFTALNKDPSVQPQVSPTLTTTTGGSVNLSFNQVDEGYPSDTPQDMGVVGGDTAQTGKQLTAFGAVAVSQPGKFWFSTATTDVYGDKDADFTTNVSAGEQLSFTGDNIPFTVGALVTGVTYVINNTVGTTEAQWKTMGATGANLGEVFIAAAAGAGTGTVSYASSSANVPLGTVASIDTVSTATASSDSGTGLITVTSTADFDLDAPIWFGADIGGLTASTTYFVKTIDSGTTFSVSATRSGTALALTSTTVVSTANIEKLDLDAVATFTKSEVAVLGSNDEAVYIKRQKGKRKYLVSNADGSRQGICTLVKKAQADLLAGEMSIEGTYDNAGVTYIESISDVNGLPFDNDAGSPLTQSDQTGMQATFEAIAGSPLAGSTKPVITLPSA